MAMNPMQRKANNYLLIGVLVTLLITGTIIGFLVYQLININKEREEEKKALKSVYVLSEDIPSGEQVSVAQLKQVKVPSSVIPVNAISTDELIEQTDETKQIYTIAKIDLSEGTILTSNMIQDSDNKMTDDVRIQEYNMISLLSQIETGDYIDIRLRLPTGEDYIVVSKKKVELPKVSGIDSVNTVWLKMSEADTLIMSNAIVEAYEMKGSKLYATKYIEPGMQTAATLTFVPKASTQALISTNPNIVQEAKNALFSIYNPNVAIRTNTINGILNTIEEDDKQKNREEGVEEEIEKAIEEREKYLESLGG